MKPHIFLVDAEPSIRGVIEQALRQEGYQVSVVTSGREALHKAAQENPDLMIVDLHLPDAAGQDICRMIRETPRVQAIPVLAVSAKDTVGLAARSLNNGADSYLLKRADAPEWIAHVRALLRRPKAYFLEEDVIQRGRVTLRLAERRGFWNSQELPPFTPKEFQLLKELILRSPRVVEKNGLVLKVWGVPLEQVGRLTLDVHIQRLRKKLGPQASAFLKTISLVGYQWTENLEQ
jgi:DNA-binding response OmpR family regulator